MRSRTKSTNPPSITVVLSHSWSSGVDVATYFSTPLMNVANGSVSLPGQYRAHSPAGPHPRGSRWGRRSFHRVLGSVERDAQRISDLALRLVPAPRD